MDSVCCYIPGNFQPSCLKNNAPRSRSREGGGVDCVWWVSVCVFLYLGPRAQAPCCAPVSVLKSFFFPLLFSLFFSPPPASFLRKTNGHECGTSGKGVHVKGRVTEIAMPAHPPISQVLSARGHQGRAAAMAWRRRDHRIRPQGHLPRPLRQLDGKSPRGRRVHLSPPGTGLGDRIRSLGQEEACPQGDHNNERRGL